MKEALFYNSFGSSSVKCLLCPHECTILDGHSGICRVRENIGGKLYAKTYNKLSSMAVDPIEKKPLRRYKPGSHILSVGTMGCNFKCGFCQNYHIAHQNPPLKEVPVDELLNISDSLKESIGIAFTYNEPTIWYEYVYEAAVKNNKDTVLITNGFINQAPLKKLLPHISAMNIDLKSMSPKFYKDVCKGDIESVQKTIETAYEKTHVELTFLAIPGLNDSEDETKKLSSWIAEIDKNIPLHIIGFRPMYKMTDVPFQTYEKIQTLKKIASKKLQFVY